MTNELEKHSVLRNAVSVTSCALRADHALLALVVSYLFGILSVFAVWFFTTALALVSWVLAAVVGGVAFCALTLPVFVGRARMAQKLAARKACAQAEIFHYFTSWRLWWRGVRIGMLFLISLLPPFFAASALAIGEEEIPLTKALSVSFRRVAFRVVLAFWGRVLLRVLLGVLTLGALWLLYDAHHTAVTYFALAEQEPLQGETL